MRTREPYGQSGMSTSTGFMPACFATSSALRSTGVVDGSFIQRGTKPTLSPLAAFVASNSSSLGTVETSLESAPEMACRTSSVSSTPRAIGPSLSRDQQSVMAPARETRPKVGLRPVQPHRIEGATMLPSVSLPIEKPTRPAAVAAPGPALDPEEPSTRSQGFMVWPPNQMSLRARAPRLSFAISTAPASCSFLTTDASCLGTRPWNGSAPYVV